MSKAASHRTYPPLTIKKDGETGYFPVGHFEARQTAFTKAGARRAWVLNGRGELEPVVIRILKDQNFASQATQFELDFSKLVALQNRADPVVTSEGEVIGHFGWFAGGFHILVPVGIGSDIRTALNDSLALGVSIFVASRNSMPSHYNLYGVTDEGFRLLTTVDGLVLAQLGYRTRDGAESVWYSPMDFLAVGKVLVGLAKSGGRITINALSRRGAKRLEALGLSKRSAEEAAKAAATATAATTARRGGRMTADEMERYLIAIMKEHPELGKLYTAYSVRGLRGEALQKEVLAILREWERIHGKSVRIVPTGTVATRARPGNVAKLEGNELIIEEQVLRNSDQFFDEIVHELSANALRVRGANITERELAFVGDAFNKLNNALFLLERSIRTRGGLKTVIQDYR